MPGVLIVAEAAGGLTAPSTLELAAVGRQLAAELGGELSAVLVGRNVAGAESQLGQHGVERVLVADDGTGTGPVSPEWLNATVVAAASQVKPEVILLSHSAAGRGMAPSIAYRLGSAAVTDVTAVRVEDGRVVFTKPVFGGSAVSEQVVATTPQVATLRPRAFEAAEPSAGANSRTEPLEVSLPGAPRVQVIEEVSEEATSGPKLKDAKVVVSGGRGLGGPDNWRHVEELAQVLGAAIGATRAVTDASWVPPSHQVGLTGATIAPDLYIAIGISGAVQHIAGISGAKNVVAINKDPEANIFKVARFGVVGDWKQVLPAFTQRLKELRS